MINNGMFTSNRDDWETPDYLFQELDREFHFDLDPCATPQNAKCKKYFTREDNGLVQDWSGHTVFCNPPYGRQLKKWVEKSYNEYKKGNTTIVLLIPARTDTQWFHDYIYNKEAEIIFIKRRIRFGGQNTDAPFPSMIVIYRKD